MSLNDLLGERSISVLELRSSSVGGNGLFAVEDIPLGQLIFKDEPIVAGPRSGAYTPGCVVCNRFQVPLRPCTQNCHLPLCSALCETDQRHKRECEFLQNVQVKGESWSPTLYRLLTPIRCLLMDEKDGEIVKLLHSNNTEDVECQVQLVLSNINRRLSDEKISWLRHCIGVLDGTGFEIEKRSNGLTWSFRGLYPLAAMMNHSCYPNTRHYFSKKGKGMTMCIVATTGIRRGDEITTNYCPLLWSTPARQQYLKLTKQFVCKCDRCSDPTEFGSNLSAVKCKCGGFLLPLFPLEPTSGWKCRTCFKTATAKQAVLIQSVAMQMDNPQKVLPGQNHIQVQRNLARIWNKEHGTDDELVTCVSYIKEILILINTLRLGDSRLKGLVLLQKYKIEKELSQRGIGQVDDDDKRKFESILEDDMSAPSVG